METGAQVKGAVVREPESILEKGYGVRVLLVRHGLTEWNAARRLQGHADIALTQKGRAQANELAPVIEQLGYERAIVSDLIRARQTAKILGVSDPIFDPALRERDAGVWTGRRVDDVRAEDPETWRAWRTGRYAPSDAETWADFTARVLQAITRHREGLEGPLLVVCHGGVIRAALCHLLDLPADRLTSVAHASLTILRSMGRPSDPKLELFNFRPGIPEFETPE